jgi:hypothetical protein
MADELTEEQKQQIVDEERRRHAEEQYRNRVCEGLRNQSAATNPVQAESRRRLPKKLLLIPILAFVVILWIVSGRGSEPYSYAPSVIATKHTQQIVSGSVVASADKVLYYRIPITEHMRDVRITGHFLALGGQNNDIEAFLADEEDFGKWMDRQPFKAFYQSGRTTSGDINVTLPPHNATYYLAFNNKFSAFSAKTINADISLNYSTIVVK